MIKIKDLENIQDTDSLTFKRINELIPELQNKHTIRPPSLKKVLSNNLKNTAD
jgi:hypothetical protein